MLDIHIKKCDNQLKPITFLRHELQLTFIFTMGVSDIYCDEYKICHFCVTHLPFKLSIKITIILITINFPLYITIYNVVLYVFK